jgi:hypothetical protein
MSAPRTPNRDDMPPEIEFCDGVRAKFYRPDARNTLPLYLEAECRLIWCRLPELGHELLKRNIAIREIR